MLSFVSGLRLQVADHDAKGSLVNEHMMKIHEQEFFLVFRIIQAARYRFSFPSRL